MLTIADLINNFWRQKLPWTVELIMALYPSYDSGLIQKLWNWCAAQDANLSNDQLIALFQSTMHIVKTPMGYDVLAGTPIPDQSDTKVGQMSRDQLLQDIYAMFHGKNPIVFP